MALKIKCEQVANNDVICPFQAFYKILLFKFFLKSIDLQFITYVVQYIYYLLE